MRRLIIFLLLWILPIQFGLAATVDVLQHARDGHSALASVHPHAAVTDDGATNVDSDNDADASAKSHGECGACHHCVHAVAVLSDSADFKRLMGVASIDSNGRDAHRGDAATGRPERPNWSALV